MVFQINVQYFLCCGKNFNAFELMQDFSSLNNGGGPHMAVSLSHAVYPSVHQQLYRQNTAVGWNGASLGVRQEQHHMHPHQMEAMPSMAHVATPGIGDPSNGGNMDHQILANMITPAISPPNHIQTMLVNQHLQQSSVSQNGDSVTVITGTNSILVGHQNTLAPLHHGGLLTPPHGVGINLHSRAWLPSQGLISSDHSAALNSSNSGSAGGMRHNPSHTDPGTPANLVPNGSTTPTTQPHNIIEDS